MSLVAPPNGKTGTEQRRCDEYGQHNVDDHAAGRPVRRQPHSTLLADGRLAGCTHARQYGIDALHADGMDWNRKAGTWIGTETAEQTITFTLA